MSRPSSRPSPDPEYVLRSHQAEVQALLFHPSQDLLLSGWASHAGTCALKYYRHLLLPHCHVMNLSVMNVITKAKAIAKRKGVGACQACLVSIVCTFCRDSEGFLTVWDLPQRRPKLQHRSLSSCSHLHLCTALIAGHRSCRIMASSDVRDDESHCAGCTQAMQVYCLWNGFLKGLC